MEGLPALELWDLVIDVFRATQEISKLTQACSGKPLASQENPTKIGQVSNVELLNIDQVPSNAHFPEKKSQPYIFEDNEAVIKMIIKARSPTMVASKCGRPKISLFFFFPLPLPFSLFFSLSLGVFLWNFGGV